MTPNPATVEAMRQASDGKEDCCSRAWTFDPHDYVLSPRLAAEVADRLVAAERAKVEAAIAKVRANYPTDVWPDDSDHAESKAARMARQTCDNILAALSPQEADRG